MLVWKVLRTGKKGQTDLLPAIELARVHQCMLRWLQEPAWFAEETDMLHFCLPRHATKLAICEVDF